MIHFVDSTLYTQALLCYSHFPAMMESSPGTPRRKARLSEGVLKIAIEDERSVCKLSHVRERIPTTLTAFGCSVKVGSGAACYPLPLAQTFRLFF